MRRFTGLVLALITHALIGTAHGKPKANVYLNNARILYQNTDYESALDRLKKAAEWAGNTEQDTVEIHIYSGLCYFSINELESADASFTQALRLQPSADLPPGTSPRIRQRFEALKKQLLPSDVPIAQTAPALIPKPDTKNEITRPATPPRSKARFVAPALVGAAAAASLGIGIYFGTQAKSHATKANSVETSFGEAQQFGKQARQEQVAANASYATAGVTAGVAVLLLVLLR